MRKESNLRLQSGYATLTMGVILLITVTLAGLYLGRSGILDLRSAANKSRAAEAFADAEANLEYGLAWFSYQSGPLSPYESILDSDELNKLRTVKLPLDNRESNPNKFDPLAPWKLCSSLSAPSEFLESKGWKAFDGDWYCIPDVKFPSSENSEIDKVINPLPDPDRSFHLLANRFGVTGGGEEWIYLLVAEGKASGASKDSPPVAYAVVQQALRFPLAGRQGFAPPPPLMGAGTIDLNGSFNLVANPNGACAPDRPSCGQPVSIWSKTAINQAPGIGNWASCQLFEYMVAACKTSPLSAKDDINQDIVPNDPNFPADMFAYVFGVPSGDFEVIRDRGEPYVYKRNDCSGLPDFVNNLERSWVVEPFDPNFPDKVLQKYEQTPIVWVKGDCDVPNSSKIGTLNGPDPKNYKPVILVVEPGAPGTGNLRMSANTEFAGMVFMFDNTGNTGQVSLNGGAKLFGALLSNNRTATGQNINGTFDLVYDMTTMKSIKASVDFNAVSILSKVPGTWADYLRPQ